jgi:hypothetical protein
MLFFLTSRSFLLSVLFDKNPGVLISHFTSTIYMRKYGARTSARTQYHLGAIRFNRRQSIFGTHKDPFHPLFLAIDGQITIFSGLHFRPVSQTKPLFFLL